MKYFIQSVLIIFIIISCEVVNFDPRVEKDKCKFAFTYSVNVTKKDSNDQDYPLFLYLAYSDYQDCVKFAEEPPLPRL